MNWYAYCANNPLIYVDPDGRALETVWDVASLGIGVYSLTQNIKEGNYLGAAVDSIGIIADAAAIVLPFVPGGASAAIKAFRIAEYSANIIGGIYDAIQGAKEGSALRIAGGVLSAATGLGANVKALNL